MKPFTTEGDAWRFLAGEFERVRSTKYSCGGLCAALRHLYHDNLIGKALLRELQQRLQMLEPTATDCADYQTDHLGWWWPLYDRKTGHAERVGRAERALACAFLAVLADEGETCDAPA